MGRIPHLILGILIAICTTFIMEAAAQAPGAGHGFLIDKHSEKGVNCAACHAAAPPPAAPAMTVCLGCHGGSYQAIAAKTTSVEPNPHASHQGDIPCASCHHIHKASESFCDQCHSFGLKTP